MTDDKAKQTAKAEADARRFIRYQALGLAIAGINQFFRRRVEVCCARSVDRLELSGSI